MNTSTVLRRARALIVKGWCKHTFNDGHGNYCSVGAVLQSSPIITPSVIVLQTCLPDTNDGSKSTVVAFNDHPTTTKCQVLALYDHAIKRSLAAERRAQRKAKREREAVLAP